MDISSCVLDIGFYKNAYADLAHLSDKHAAMHYNKHGKKEKRLASKNMFCELFPDFDIEFYKKNYPDLKSFTHEQIYVHYYTHGFYEKRIPNREQLLKTFYENLKIVQETNQKYLKEIIHENNSIKSRFCILIRTCNRPNLFVSCLKSVLEQKSTVLKEIHISVDNVFSLNYVREYIKDFGDFIGDERTKIIVHTFFEKKGEDYFYNDYLNSMIKTIEIIKFTETWVLILDDDNKFYSNKTFEILHDAISKNNYSSIFVWKYFRPDSLIYPKNPLEPETLEIGELGTASFMFNLNILKNHDIKFEKKRCCDYYFYKKLTQYEKNICFLNCFLTRTIYYDCIQFGGNTEKEPEIFDLCEELC